MALSHGRYLSAKMLSEELGIDLRTIYRYLDDIKESDFFKFEKRGKKMRISRDSLFWTSVMKSLFLTDKEAEALQPILEKLDTDNPNIKSVRNKVREIMANYIEPMAKDADVKIVNNTALIQQAIDEQRLCMLRGYTSLHSDSKSDRLVEPFAFLGSKNDVRCYELATKMNKTFKVSRCDSVELLDVNWQFEKKHKVMYTDIFHFSDEKKTRVRLLLGTRAKTILVEEHPEAERYLIPHPDGRWMLDAEYCSMKGVGRFYLGLFEDIEIVDSPKFKEYLTDRIKGLTDLL